jgi:3-methyl-2-oxobutanoate hydroxymethyltransferase
VVPHDQAQQGGRVGDLTNAMKQYVAEVRGNKFPEDEHCYHMLPGELEKFQAELK